MKIISLAVGALLASPVAAMYMRMGGTLQEFLDTLEEGGDITEEQHSEMNAFLPDGSDFNMTQHEIDNQAFLRTEEGKGLVEYIDAEYAAGDITEDTRIYLGSLLHLDEYEPAVSTTSFSGPARKEYEGNGIVEFISRWNGNNGGTLYNGIWGYSKGSREYALQCTGNGIWILDVTDDSGVEEVQFFPMSGGNPWRDVAVWNDYAYVASQGGNGEFYVIKLQQLSGSGPNGFDPIPSSDWANRGRANDGHTLSITDGLLFLNTASTPCEIFDLDANPFNPPLISGSVGECHDSFAVKDFPMPDGSQKDLLFSADGYSTKFNVEDLTGVRDGQSPVRIGSTSTEFGIYAHQNFVDEDNQYMYTAEEFNQYDIGVVDVSDPFNPDKVNEFQWSGEQTEGNSRIHNSQVYGNYLISAYYSAGLRVFDISNHMDPVEVGKLETWRDQNMDGINENSITSGYDGAWNVYCFLPSGRMLISDADGGLYVFRLDTCTDCTSAPTKTPAPTQTVTDPCQGQIDFVIELTTDKWSYETAWTLKRDSDGETLLTNPIMENNEDYTTSTCLPAGECYTYEITDSFGDGICCTQGDGEYTLTLDGEIIKLGGDFDSSETTPFCIEENPCVDDPAFVKTRGRKNQVRNRTCAYIAMFPWRVDKWCQKMHRGERIADICCNTCANVQIQAQ